jgi:anti-sigma B factor antagonist
MSLTVSVAEAGAPGGPCTVMRLAGEADVTTTQLGAALEAEVAKRPRVLLVEMSALTFIDSAAIHEVVRAHRQLSGEGRTLALVSPSGLVARVLSLTGLDQVIHVYQSLDEAMAGQAS